MPKRLFEISVEPQDAIILPKKKYVLYWKAFDVKTALPNYADEKVSIGFNRKTRYSKTFSSSSIFIPHSSGLASRNKLPQTRPQSSGQQDKH